MKVKYIIKKVLTATPDNPNFAGETHIHCYGKAQTCISSTYKNCKTPQRNVELTTHALDEYGYDRKCDAVRSWIFRHPEDSRFWDSTVSIVRVSY